MSKKNKSKNKKQEERVIPTVEKIADEILRLCEIRPEFRYPGVLDKALKDYTEDKKIWEKADDYLLRELRNFYSYLENEDDNFEKEVKNKKEDKEEFREEDISQEYVDKIVEDGKNIGKNPQFADEWGLFLDDEDEQEIYDFGIDF